MPNFLYELTENENRLVQAICESPTAQELVDNVREFKKNKWTYFDQITFNDDTVAKLSTWLCLTLNIEDLEEEYPIFYSRLTRFFVLNEEGYLDETTDERRFIKLLPVLLANKTQLHARYGMFNNIIRSGKTQEFLDIINLAIKQQQDQRVKSAGDLACHKEFISNWIATNVPAYAFDTFPSSVYDLLDEKIASVLDKTSLLQKHFTLRLSITPLEIVAEENRTKPPSVIAQGDNHCTYTTYVDDDD